MKKRSLHYNINTAISLVLVLGIAVILGILGTKYHHQWDLTANKRFTLAPQSVKILKNLKDELLIKAFYIKGTERSAEDIFKQFAYYSPMIKYEFIDPNKDPRLAREYEISQPGTVFVLCGKNREKLMQVSEEKLINTIIKATRKEKRLVYFLKGHGERGLNIPGQQGLTALKEALEKENYEVEDFLLMRRQSVPERVSLLVVAGPLTKFQPEELEGIKNYFNTGGRAVFLIDINTPKQVTDFLTAYGFQVDDDIIIDPSSQMVGANYYVAMVAEYDQSFPITADFNLACFFPICRSMKAGGGPPASYVKWVARTSQYTWGIDKNRKEINGQIKVDPRKDKRGPLEVAAAGSYQVADGKKEARIVVLGSTDFIANGSIGLSGNRDFFLNCMGWLTQQEDLISIRPKAEENTPVFFNTKQKYGVFFFGLVFLPLLLTIIAIIIFIRRR
ncbi:MAG: GldG family protein [Chloroflexi bacterium]|nr:GldG family protein [Chloroflexota bacterium]